MAATQAFLDALEEAYYSGALTVEYEDKKITFPGAKDLERRLFALRRALGKVNSGTRFTPKYSKGL
ncbi:MAG: hypothetical protein COB04_16105 [Gammaproteobacteria bacterium]|nr:MAG: hypothetical protein COB04_16105 [Gammaproteobacteria bacterium]